MRWRDNGRQHERRFATAEDAAAFEAELAAAGARTRSSGWVSRKAATDPHTTTCDCGELVLLAADVDTPLNVDEIIPAGPCLRCRRRGPREECPVCHGTGIFGEQLHNHEVFVALSAGGATAFVTLADRATGQALHRFHSGCGA